MARIRTIKPDFFRHELLQDLEREHGDLKPMLVFAGLWGQCDKAGTFEWRPRQLHLDILPFVDFDMADALALLVEHHLVITWEAEGKQWGNIPSFPDHQRITGKEAQAKSRYPQAPSDSPQVVDPLKGHNGEASGCVTGAQEGKGKRKEERNGMVGVPRETPPARSGSDERRELVTKIQAVYPKGLYTAAHWITAEREINRLLDQGEPPELLLANTEAYRRQVNAAGRAGTKGVFGPGTFFVDGHWRGPFDLPVDPKAEALAAWDRVIAHVRNSMRGPSPGGKIDAVVRAVGGYTAIGSTDNTRNPAFKNRFVQLWPTLDERGEAVA